MAEEVTTSSADIHVGHKSDHQSQTHVKSGRDRTRIVLDKYLVFLILILILALAVRIYFFWQFKSQPLWWDESEHMLMAKHIAFGTPSTGWNESREIIVPLIFSFFFKLFQSEVAIRFIQLLLSLAIVFLTYLLGKEMFDKSIGLIASFLMAIFFQFLFWGLRFGYEIFGMVFLLLAILFFWKGYFKKEKNYYIYLAAVFGALAVMTSSKEGLVALSVFVFLFLSDRFAFLKNKHFWITILVGIALTVPYMLYYKSTTGHFLPRASTTATAVTAAQEAGGWSWSNFFLFSFDMRTMLFLPFLIVFLIGLIYILV
ncbi:MAG: glycosyltransferase family 39 protein, partial [Nanoarchaeota archaeon]